MFTTMPSFYVGCQGSKFRSSRYVAGLFTDRSTFSASSIFLKDIFS